MYKTEQQQTTLPSCTESVQAALRGEQHGFRALYDLTYRDKFYIAMKYMKDENAAQDVMQDAYVKAFKTLSTLEDAEKFPAWFGAIVANTALDALKAARRQPLLFAQMAGEDEEGGQYDVEIEDIRPDIQPELSYTKQEANEILHGLIDALTDEQRMCVLMHYIEDIPVKEIARQMNCSENTVKTRLHYARKNLKDSADKLGKKGYRLYGIAPVHLLILLVFRECATFRAPIPGAAGASASSGAGSAGTVSGAGAHGAATGGGVSMTGTGTGVGVGTATGTGTGGAAIGTGAATGSGITTGTAGAATGSGVMAGSAGAVAAGAAAVGAGTTAKIIAACVAGVVGIAAIGTVVATTVTVRNRQNTASSAVTGSAVAGSSRDLADASAAGTLPDDTQADPAQGSDPSRGGSLSGTDSSSAGAVSGRNTSTGATSDRASADASSRRFTDWHQAYASYLTENEASIRTEDGQEKIFRILYVDDNEIPEIVVSHMTDGTETGDLMLSFSDGYVTDLNLGSRSGTSDVYYTERTGGIWLNDNHDEGETEIICALTNGTFRFVFRGSIASDNTGARIWKADGETVTETQYKQKRKQVVDRYGLEGSVPFTEGNTRTLQWDELLDQLSEGRS